MAVITVVVMAAAGGSSGCSPAGSSPDFKDLALAFSLICLPQIFFYGLFALLGQILNARGQFAAFAWAPFIANVVAVTGLVLFLFVFPKDAPRGAPGRDQPRDPSEWTGPMIWLFAGSATLSVIVQALSLVPALRRTGFHYRPRWGLRGVGLGGVSRLALWAFGGLAVSQVGFFISQGVLNNATASATALGLEDAVRGPAAYAIAFTLFMLPHAFITVSIITALFPRFSAAAASGDKESLRRDFRTGLTMPLVANVPIMVAVIVLAEPIVALLNPGIEPRSVEVSASVLIIMILGLVPFGLDLLCYRMFFALEDGKPTVVMQVLLTGISALAGVVTLFINPVWAIGVMAMGQTVGNVVRLHGRPLPAASAHREARPRGGARHGVARRPRRRRRRRRRLGCHPGARPHHRGRGRGNDLGPQADVRQCHRDRSRRSRLRRHLPRHRPRHARARGAPGRRHGPPAARSLTEPPTAPAPFSSPRVSRPSPTGRQMPVPGLLPAAVPVWVRRRCRYRHHRWSGSRRTAYRQHGDATGAGRPG